ncbi:MAG: gliding motility lipoprotein GldD [Bacteroidota bacterium]|nr:gliding motility lipoprotein GldD [Bacteroidota bacterium]
MKILPSFILFLTIGSACLFESCNKTAIPRPYGYFRVDLPAHAYRTIDTLNLPYRFDLPKNALLISRKAEGEMFWIDLYYPKLNASIYCSYKPVKGNLIDLLEDTRKIVYKHSVRADGIGEKVYDHPEKNVHGILYDLRGNTASSVQFILTDSTHNFFRGALYFNNVPNKDSIAPMANYIREDVIRIMESFEWKR